MDMEVYMEAEPVFEAQEVDPDYEFDAARFFDFTREETRDEACEAEIWFASAKSYPPSPFVAKLVPREDFLMENVNVSPKTNRENLCSSVYGGYQVSWSQEFYGKDVNNGDCEVKERGIFGDLRKVLNQPHGVSTGIYNYLSNKPKGKTNSSAKASYPRSSTLMKPTASQLAKQNRFPQVGSSRYQIPLIQNNQKILSSSSVVEHQAPKRQKLEGGHSLKVTDGKDQTSFVHKVPKRDETLDKISGHAKLKLTIPREPELETAHRAHRTRNGGTELKEVTSTVRKFKARPFNRKIFEAPSLPLPKRSTPKLPEFQVFHLKTMERARQTAPAVSCSNLCNDCDKEVDKPSTSDNAENGNRESRKPTTGEVLKQDGDGMHRFRALPLNKKIISSKGDLGIFRKTKREATVPMEFNFRTERRIQQNPPTDLFSKLSLASELQPNKGSQLKFPRSNSLAVEGSKENRLDHFQPENKMTDSAAEKTSIFSRKQVVCGSSDGGLSEIGNKLQARSWGIH